MLADRLRKGRPVAFALLELGQLLLREVDRRGVELVPTFDLHGEGVHIFLLHESVGLDLGNLCLEVSHGVTVNPATVFGDQEAVAGLESGLAGVEPEQVLELFLALEGGVIQKLLEGFDLGGCHGVFLLSVVWAGGAGPGGLSSFFNNFIL